jgi:hypothetical protein
MCRYAVCRYAVCRYAECRGAALENVLFFQNVFFTKLVFRSFEGYVETVNIVHLKIKKNKMLKNTLTPSFLLPFNEYCNHCACKDIKYIQLVLVHKHVDYLVILLCCRYM